MSVSIVPDVRMNVGEFLAWSELHPEPEDQRYEKVRDSITKQLNGKVAEEKNIKQDVVPGKEYLIEGDKSMVRMQLFIVRGWVMYAIVEAENKDRLTSPEAQSFFRGFKLSDEAKRLVK